MVTHPRLVALDEVNLHYELEKSSEEILEQLGPKHTFSAIIYQGIYPVMKLCPSNVVHNSEKTFRLCFLAVDTNP